MRKYKFIYLNMSQAVVISESIGGKPFSDKRFRYTGPTDGFPFSPLTPSSTFAAKDFILSLFFLLVLWSYFSWCKRKFNTALIDEWCNVKYNKRITKGNNMVTKWGRLTYFAFCIIKIVVRKQIQKFHELVCLRTPHFFGYIYI